MRGMEQEDQQQPEESQGKSGKRMKQKKSKIPQRGLGVAVLEKMRLEEQSKRHTSFLSTSSPTSPDFTFKQAVPITGYELFIAHTSPVLSLAPPCPREDLSFLPLMWNGMNRLSAHEQKHVQFILPHNSSQVASMKNVSWSAAPSGIHLPVEFPSNQMLMGGSSALLWQDQERMGGMKRDPLPLLDSPPRGTSSLLELPPSYWHDHKLKLEPHASSSRNEINLVPNSSITFDDQYINEPAREATTGSNSKTTSRCLDGSFLTLATPKQEQDIIQYEESMELFCPHMEPQQQRRHPFYRFFPVEPSENDPIVEEKEGVDLSLKL